MTKRPPEPGCPAIAVAADELEEWIDRLEGGPIPERLLLALRCLREFGLVVLALREADDDRSR